MPLNVRSSRNEQKVLNTRVTIVMWLIVAGFVFVAGSFWYVQGVQAEEYQGLAESNRLREVKVPAKRGLILDRNGKILVDNEASYTISLRRRDYRDLSDAEKEALHEFLARTVGTSREFVVERITRENRVPTALPLPLFEDLSLKEVAVIEAHHAVYPTLEIETIQRRNYRYDTMAAHVLGYIGEANDRDLERDKTLKMGDFIGKRGVEEIYDQFLRGKDGADYMVVDSRGRTISEYTDARKEPLPGSNIFLTIDFDLQRISEQFFAENEIVGAAVALDPRTGEVLAMVSSPSYNPNVYSRRFTPEVWKTILSNPFRIEVNRATQGLYSPGSVFKVVMGMAGFSNNVINPSTTFYCSGSERFSGRRFRCWKREGHGAVNFERAIKISCDIYFYNVGERLGVDRIAEFSRKLSFGERTTIDLPGEKAGLIPSTEWAEKVQNRKWYPSETISVAIGQGPLLVTVLQTANMMAAIANGGEVYRPHVLRIVDQVNPDRTVERRIAQPAVLREVELDDDALRSVREGLWKVVNEPGGTGSRARVEGFDVAGKTGTIQVIAQATWIKSEDLPFKFRDHAFFASFAPKDNPEIVVAVLAEHGGHGGSDAAPLAGSIYKAYFRSQIAQDRRDLSNPEQIEMLREGDLPRAGEATRSR